MEFLKGMLQSKTMWLNGGVTLLGVIGWAQDHSALLTAIAPQLGPFLAILGGVGMVLRVLTEWVVVPLAVAANGALSDAESGGD